MDKYKKKSFNFLNSETSKFTRVTETLRTRESSRFKRLSFLRSMDTDSQDSDCKEKTEVIKKPKPPSRLEMLAKYKKEKLMKKEMEKKNAAKPFYTSTASIKVNNYKVTSETSLQKSRIPSNPKMVTSAVLSQKSRTPNNPKVVNPGTSMQTSRNQSNSKMNIPNGTKMTYNSSKSNRSVGNTVASSKNQVKSGSSTQTSSSQTTLKMNNARTNVNNGLKKESKPFGAPIVSSKKQTEVTTFSSSRGIPKIQSKMPIPSFGITKKPSASLVSKMPVSSLSNYKKPLVPVSKNNEKMPVSSSSNYKKPLAPVSKNNEKAPMTVKNGEKGFGFKKAILEFSGGKKKLPANTNAVQNKEGTLRETSEKLNSLERNKSEIFDCDCSIIAPSFAPDDFQFTFPASFSEEALARIKSIVSRTSTPSKLPKKSLTENTIDFNETSLNNPSTTTKENISEIVNEKINVEDLGLVFKCSSPSKLSDKSLTEVTDNFNKSSTNNHSTTTKENVKVANEETDVENFGSVFKCSSPSKLSEKSLTEVTDNFNKSSINNHSTTAKENVKVVNEETDVEIFDSVFKCSTPPKPCDNLINEFKSNNFIKVNEIPGQSKNEKTGVEKELHVALDEVLQKSVVERELLKNSDYDLGNDEISMKEEKNELLVCQSPKLSEDGDSIHLLMKIKEAVEKFEEEEEFNNYEPKNNDSEKFNKKKLSKVAAKRPSMLKNMAVLNAIVETDETVILTPTEATQKVFTPRRSQRLSKLISIEESPIIAITDTPRRSGRLLAKSDKNLQFEGKKLNSPFTDKKSGRKSISRQLVDISIPDKGVTRRKNSSTNITTDFDRLSLEDFENMDPNDFLVDFENSPEENLKSKKVSLLYSPEKRRSIRKSIRGDLMSFSPLN